MSDTPTWHHLDAAGWYAGSGDTEGPRSVAEPPPVDSTATTPGEPRARWARWEWRVEPYQDVERERVVASVKAERDRRKAAGVQAGGHWFHSDADSRIQQLALFVMGAAVPPVEWKTLGGDFATMTQPLAAQIFAATAAQDQALFAHAETLIAAVRAAQDPATVDITAGWPPGYPGG